MSRYQLDNRGAVIYYPDSRVNFIRRAVRARGDRRGRTRERGTVGTVVQLSAAVKLLIIWTCARLHEQIVKLRRESTWATDGLVLVKSERNEWIKILAISRNNTWRCLCSLFSKAIHQPAGEQGNRLINYLSFLWSGNTQRVPRKVIVSRTNVLAP